MVNQRDYKRRPTYQQPLKRDKHTKQNLPPCNGPLVSIAEGRGIWSTVQEEGRNGELLSDEATNEGEEGNHHHHHGEGEEKVGEEEEEEGEGEEEKKI